jgi:hypothetical protein
VTTTANDNHDSDGIPAKRHSRLLSLSAPYCIYIVYIAQQPAITLVGFNAYQTYILSNRYKIVAQPATPAAGILKGEGPKMRGFTSYQKWGEECLYENVGGAAIILDDSEEQF